MSDANDLAAKAVAIVKGNPELKISVKHAKIALKTYKGDVNKAVEFLKANPPTAPAKVGPGTMLMKAVGGSGQDCEFGVNIRGTQKMGAGAATFTCNKPNCEAHEPRQPKD